MCVDVRVSGEGKGWARGRTSATDGRIARNAEAHRGLTYRRHLPASRDRRYASGGARTLPLEWSDAMAYVVGLIATDGCLITRERRHISFDSCDEQLVRTYLECLGRAPRYRALRTAAGGVRYQAQFSDVRFYRWLESVGLAPRKSLTLGAIAVPDRFALPLLRGLLDGDGHIASFVHRPTTATYPDYEYERLVVSFYSASSAHLEWVRETIGRLCSVDGSLRCDRRAPPRHDFYALRYGKRASIALLGALYPHPDVPMLERKYAIWMDYARRHGLP